MDSGISSHLVASRLARVRHPPVTQPALVISSTMWREETICPPRKRDPDGGPPKQIRIPTGRGILLGFKEKLRDALLLFGCGFWYSGLS